MKQEDTKRRILEKALELFSTRGYDSVSVGEIAQAVGIKAPSLYNHFPGKRAIFDAIVEATAAQYERDTDRIDIHVQNARQDIPVFTRITEDGLLEKVKCGSDRRGYILRLTESGQALAKQVTACHEARVDKLLGCLSDDEQLALLAMLDKLTLHWSSDEVASMFEKQNLSGEMTQL